MVGRFLVGQVCVFVGFYNGFRGFGKIVWGDLVLGELVGAKRGRLDRRRNGLSRHSEFLMGSLPPSADDIEVNTVDKSITVGVALEVGINRGLPVDTNDVEVQVGPQIHHH